MSDKILVTGADGFIGSHVVEELVRTGRHVKAFCCYNSLGSYGWLDTIDTKTKKEIEFVLGDVRDFFSMRDGMRGCTHVLHLAALIAIPYSYVAPESYVDVNVKGTLNVLQSARDLGVEKVVCTSTSEVYGTAQFVPITEDHPLVAQSPYAATKIAADQLALSFYRSFQLPVAVARPFNTYGPRQSARAIIPTLITQLLKGNGLLKIGASTPTRDFNFCLDTARGLISIMDEPATVGEVANIGAGFEISVSDLGRLIGNIMNKEVSFTEEKGRLRPEKSEVERLWSCSEKAKKIISYSPHYGGIEGLKKGLEGTIDWFSQEKNLEKYRAAEYVI